MLWKLHHLPEAQPFQLTPDREARIAMGPLLVWADGLEGCHCASREERLGQARGERGQWKAVEAAIFPPAPARFLSFNFPSTVLTGLSVSPNFLSTEGGANSITACRSVDGRA